MTIKDVCTQRSGEFGRAKVWFCSLNVSMKFKLYVSSYVFFFEQIKNTLFFLRPQFDIEVTCEQGWLQQNIKVAHSTQENQTRRGGARTGGPCIYKNIQLWFVCLFFQPNHPHRPTITISITVVFLHFSLIFLSLWPDCQNTFAKYI